MTLFKFALFLLYNKHLFSNKKRSFKHKFKGHFKKYLTVRD